MYDFFLNDGGCYTPAVDIWQLVATNGAPAGRDNHTAVWTGSQMVVWGGTDGGYFNDVWTYVPSALTSLGVPLTIALTAAGVTVSWPDPSSNLVLQQCSDLSQAAWAVCGLPVNTNGAVNSVAMPPAVGNMFFRLSSQ
jgi:hypothetical protein